ncbi:MAG: glycosyltransferase family 4 protein [Caldimonas sp.]
MHVALLSPAWPLDQYPNGVVTYVHWMREELRRAGHDVSIFCVTLGHPEKGVYQVKPSLRRRLRAWLASTGGQASQHWMLHWGSVCADAIRAVHRSQPIDVIEMEESFGWCGDVAAATGIPTIVKLHGPAFMSMVEEERKTPFARVKIDKEGQALARVAVILAPSHCTLRETVTHYRLKPTVQRAVVNPLALPPGAPLWDLKGCNAQTILFVGRFDKLKGADIVLEAFRKLLKTRPELRLIFVGPDAGIPTQEGPLEHFEAYRARLFPAEQAANVSFRGKLKPEEIYTLRAEAFVTVVASRWENQSYTALEAMLQGCPLVSTDAGGQAEIVAHGSTGLLARSGSADDFHDKIELLLRDPQYAAALGRAGRAYVLDRHSPARVASETLAAYREAILLSASAPAAVNPQAA